MQQNPKTPVAGTWLNQLTLPAFLPLMHASSTSSNSSCEGLWPLEIIISSARIASAVLPRYSSQRRTAQRIVAKRRTVPRRRCCEHDNIVLSRAAFYGSLTTPTELSTCTQRPSWSPRPFRPVRTPFQLQGALIGRGRAPTFTPVGDVDRCCPARRR